MSANSSSSSHPAGPDITCRSTAAWELLQLAVEKAAEAAAEKAAEVWTWQECREESGVAAGLSLFSSLVVLVVVLT